MYARVNRHHMLPISLGGPDVSQNIMTIDADVHDRLHRLMNIPTKMYSRRQRLHKEKSNQSLVTRPDEVARIGDIQKEFLMSLHKLPRRLQQKHVQQMMKLMDKQRSDYLRLTKDVYDKPLLCGTIKENVFRVHDFYIECRKETAKEILTLLKAAKDLNILNTYERDKRS